MRSASPSAWRAGTLSNLARAGADSQRHLPKIDLHYPRPANDDVGAAIGRLKDLIKRDNRVLRVAAIGVASVGDAGYTLAAQVWVRQPDAQAVKYDLNRTVKEDLDRGFKAHIQFG